MGIAGTILIGFVVGRIGWLFLPTILTISVFATAFFGAIVVAAICVLVGRRIFETW